ncbi:MAG: cytochrome c-type biogenesis protein CcmH [Chloroflexota bacterium]
MTVLGRRIERRDAVLLLAVAVVVVTIVVAAATSSAGRGLDERARDIEAQLRCPTCQGLSIQDSPATSAMQMRALVREQLAGGASDEAVRAFFVARYGRWILLDPPLAGPDLALWLAPAVIVATGALLVVRRARRRDSEGSVRRWAALPSLPTTRLPAIAIGGAMVLALAVPIAAAVVPRLNGQEVSGGGAARTAPSIQELEAFVRAEPRDVEALVALADALLEANRVGEAGNRYRTAIELDPDNIPALLGVGTILLGSDRPDAAQPVFDRILALSRDQPDALLYRAIALVRLDGGVSDRARRDVVRFLAVTPAGDPRRAMATALLDGSPIPAPDSSAPDSSGPDSSGPDSSAPDSSAPAPSATPRP